MVSTRSGSSVKKSPKSPTLEPRHATRRHKLIEDDSNDDESDFLSLKSSKKEFLSVEFSHDTPKSLYNDSPVLKRPSRRREPSRHLNDEEEYLSKVERQKRNHTRSLFSLGLEDEGSSCEEDGIGSLAASSRARTSSRDKNFPNMLLRRGINGENQVDRNEIKYRERARSQSKEHVNPELRSLLKAQGKDPASALNSSQPDIYSSIKSRHRLRRPRVFYGDYEFATSSSQSRLEDDPNTSTEVGDLGSDPKEQDLHQSNEKI